MTAGFWERLAARLRPTDSLKTIEDPRVIVRAVTAGIGLGVIQLLVTALIWAAFDEPAVAWAALLLAGAFVVGWVVFATTGSIFSAAVIGLISGTLGNTYAHVELGGYAYSGAIFLFGIMFVSTVALLLGRKMTIAAGITYALVAVVLALLEGSLRDGRDAPSATLTTILFVLVLIGSINIIAPLTLYFMGRLGHERERAERLLLNVLPRQVATELKETGTARAQRFDEVSVLFVDIVGFTPLTASMEPEDIVDQLNDVFSYFDELADRYQVEKIRTMGDSYMVAAGVPESRKDHAQALSAMALDMLAYSDLVPMSFRIGINSGPAVAGVIGKKKFQYDIWGDTVNTAQRMESYGQPARIQITSATYDLIKGEFLATPRGAVDVKGKGTIHTWWLNAIATP